MLKNIIVSVVAIVSAISTTNAQVKLGKMEEVEARLIGMMATNVNPAELRDLAAAVRDIKLSRAVDVEARLAGLVERAVRIAPTAIRAVKAEVAKQEKVEPMLDWVWEAAASFLEGDESLNRVLATLPKAMAAAEADRQLWIKEQEKKSEARELESRKLGPVMPR